MGMESLSPSRNTLYGRYWCIKVPLEACLTTYHLVLLNCLHRNINSDIRCKDEKHVLQIIYFCWPVRLTKRKGKLMQTIVCPRLFWNPYKHILPIQH